MSESRAPDGEPPPANELRREAERRLSDRRSASAQSMSEVDARALVHELEVHQIELEMQNEELQRAQAEAREALEKYYDLFDFAPVGYFLLDEEGRVREVNLAGAVLLGLDRVAVTQKRFGQFVAIQDRPAMAEFCKRVLLADTKQTCEVKLVRGEQVVSVILEGVAAPNAKGQGKFCRVAALDITARKQAEERLDKLNRALEQDKAELVRRAAQLRAMATALAQAEQRERRRMAMLLHEHLQQLLVAARLKVGHVFRRLQQDEIPTHAAVEAERLIDECIQSSRSLTAELSPPVLYDGGLAMGLDWLARSMEEKYGMTIHVAADRANEPADESLRVFLFQAVRELLLNVVKHACAQEAHVAMTRTDDGGLRIEVKDHGAGCDPARCVGPASADAGGFGLLSIRERLESLGGRMEVETAPGAGVRVVILVPPGAVRTAGNSAPPQQRDTPVTDAVSNCGSGLRVLLADDHPLVRMGLAELLRELAGIEVLIEAGDGQEALELALEVQPDIILMDITMPRMDGIEATRRIKASLPQVPVIGLSMHSDDRMAKAMRDAGAVAFVRKDAPVNVLIAAILEHAREQPILRTCDTEA